MRKLKKLSIYFIALSLLFYFCLETKRYNSQDKCMIKDSNRSYVKDIETKIDSKNLSFPHVFETLSHLKDYEKKTMNPKQVISSNKNRLASLVIGIPTMKRANATYLYKMLDSLFNAISSDERDKLLLVILITEVI